MIIQARFIFPLFLLILTAWARASTIRVDLGPSQAGVGMENANGISSNVSLNKATLLDTGGKDTGIGLDISGWNGGTSNIAATAPFTGDAAIFNGVKSSLYQSNSATPTVTLTGLSATATYDLVLFSAKFARGVRDSQFFIAAGNRPTILTLDAANNLSRVVTATGLTADAKGEIRITVAQGPDSNQKHFYFSAMEITENAVSEPAAAALADPPAVTGRGEAPLNLLFFGNSFTVHEDIPSRVRNLAFTGNHGLPVIVADLAGGTDLDRHIGSVADTPTANLTHSALPAGDTFDVVIMQGFSTEATRLRDDPADNPFEQDVLALYQAVAHHPSGKGKGVTGVLYQTWARPNLIPRTFSTLGNMQAEITAGYQAGYDLVTATEGAGAARIAPVGQAFERGGFDRSLFENDRYHQNAKGATLAALVLYRTIYEEDVGDIAYSQVSSWIDLDAAGWAEVTAWADAIPIATPSPDRR